MHSNTRTTREHQRLVRRVQVASMHETFREHGCDRTTIKHGQDLDVPDYKTPTYTTENDIRMRLMEDIRKVLKKK